MHIIHTHTHTHTLQTQTQTHARASVRPARAPVCLAEPPPRKLDVALLKFEHRQIILRLYVRGVCSQRDLKRLS